jgi:hypothetical protein
MCVAERCSQRARWLIPTFSSACLAYSTTVGVVVCVVFGVFMVLWAMCLEAVGVWLPLGFIRPDHATLDVLRVCSGLEVRRSYTGRVVANEVVNVVPLWDVPVLPQVCLLVGTNVHPVNPEMSVSALEFCACPLPTIVRFVYVLPESDLRVLSRSSHRNYGTRQELKSRREIPKAVRAGSDLQFLPNNITFEKCGSRKLSRSRQG